MSDSVDWLRARTDEQMVALLQARPDLAVPVPTDLTVLARRLDAPHSVWRVLESCTAFEVAVIEALLILRRPKKTVTTEEVVTVLDVDPAAVEQVLDGLQTRALVRQEQTGWRVSAALPPAFGDHPGGVGPPGPLTHDQAAKLIDTLDPTEQDLLRRLAGGRPRGTVSAGSAATVQTLVAEGLLLPVDESTVVLTREAGTVLRGGLLAPVQVTPPPVPLTLPGADTVDRTAADRALAVVGAARALTAMLRRNPVPELRSGGIGALPTRRLAKELDLSVPQVCLLLELLSAEGTLGVRAGAQGLVWTARSDDPTPVADDDPATAWAALATTWLQLRREPARAGTKDEAGKLRAVLSAELHWHRGPADRTFVLSGLAALEPGTGLGEDDLVRRLTWLAPLRQPDRRAALTATVLAEATWLGVVAYDSLTAAGRALLAGDDAAPALTAALPPAVETLLVQADLTVLVPGRPTPEIAHRLDVVADLESSGGASVYRVTPESLRRGFDRGLEPADLHHFFADHSATGIPQSLTYLIDDVARRHGTLRIGPASAFLRSDDPALLDSAVVRAQAAGLTVRRLAPTVAVTTADPARLLTLLDGDGLLPVLEDSTGAVIDPTATDPEQDQADLRPVRTRRLSAEPPTPSADQLLTLIRRLRMVDTPASAGDPAEMAAVLRAAADDRTPVWVGYVESDGRAHTRLIEPIAVSGGAVAAFDRLRGTMRSFALHRITAVGEADESPSPSEPV